MDPPMMIDIRDNNKISPFPFGVRKKSFDFDPPSWHEVRAVNWIKIESDFIERLDRDVAPVTSKSVNWYDDDFNDYYVSYF